MTVPIFYTPDFYLADWQKKPPAKKLMRVFRKTNSKIFVMNQDSWFLSQLSRVSVRSIFGNCTWYRRTNFSITAVNFTDRELHRRLIDKTYLHDVWQNNFKIVYSIVRSSLFGRFKNAPNALPYYSYGIIAHLILFDQWFGVQ